MQFGEGNFLRAFVEWILQDLNDKGAIDADVVVIQPMPFGRVKELAEQDGLYTLRLEGIDKGERVRKSEIIDVIGDLVNPFTDYQKFLAYGESEDLQIVISNTTEAGIALDPSDTDFSQCPKSFPGKLLALLKRRYDKFGGDFSKGLAIVPCELIDNNGTEVKIQHAEGLADCKKTLMLAKAGKLNGCMIEGMGCPGGCVAGVGTIIPVERAKATVAQMVAASSKPVPDKELEEEGERLTRMSPPKDPSLD